MSIFINIFIVSLMVGGAIGWFYAKAHERSMKKAGKLTAKQVRDLWTKITNIPDIPTITMEELEELAKAEETEG